jgi:hypothetical protein
MYRNIVDVTCSFDLICFLLQFMKKNRHSFLLIQWYLNIYTKLADFKSAENRVEMEFL